MSLTKENSIEYVYNEDEDIGIENEYVYDELSSAKSTKEDIGIESEYVYDEESSAKSTKDSIKDIFPDNKKPTHKTSEFNVYDELDYNLSPNVENHNETKKVNYDQTVSKESKEKESHFTICGYEVNLKKKTIIIGALCVCVILIIIVGAAVGQKGKNIAVTFILLAISLAMNIIVSVFKLIIES